MERVASGQVAENLLEEADFHALIEQEVFILDGRPFDVDVRLARGRRTVRCRLVGVRGPQGYCWYLTSLPRDTSPDEVRPLYAVRWEIELDNKVDKSSRRLDESGARTPATVRALAHASVVASIIVSLLAHHHWLEVGPAPHNRPYRTRPPIHPQTLGRMVATTAASTAVAMERTGAEAQAEWGRLAELFVHQGTDPNWRRRPAVLDRHPRMEGTPRSSSASKGPENKGWWP